MMFEKRPREYAAEMLRAFKQWEKQWMEQVPAELRGMVSDHVHGRLAKEFSLKKWKDKK